MNIHITQREGVPIYLQIIKQIKNLIVSKRIIEDQELMPIRVLAEQIVVNPNTVAKAYRELELAGWIYKKRGSGTFVSALNPKLTEETCQQQIRSQIELLLEQAEQLNISTEQILEMVRQHSKIEPKEK